MTELLAFVERHPVWTLVYLIVIGGALQGIVRFRFGEQIMSLFSHDGITYVMSPELAALFRTGDASHERELIGWAAQFLKPEKTFVDVGAHVGTWSLPFAKRCKRVVAIEPHPRNYACLVGGIAANDLWNVIAYRAAASNAPGKTELNVGVHDWSGFGGSLENFPINGETRAVDVTLLPVDRLDLRDVGLVKIDVEGHELEVLQGLSVTLEVSGYPTLLVEVWDSADPRFAWYADKRAATLRYLQSLGYDPIPVAGWPHMQLCGRR